MLQSPFYDPQKTYDENFNQGPFGAFTDGKKYKEKGEPTVDVFGIKVHLPFGIANGPLINGKFVKAALDKGFDIVEYKDVRTKKVLCNPFPNVVPLKIKGDITLDVAEQGITTAPKFEQPLTITNSFGIPSMDPDFWLEDLTKTIKYAKKGQLVIAGLQGTIPESGGFEAYLKDFIQDAKLIVKTKPKIIELNLSCPNEGAGNLLCFDTKRSTLVAEKVKNEIGNIPLLIKIAYFSDQEKLKELVRGVGKFVQGIAAINTIPAKITDEKGNQALPGKGRLYSGTCGQGIKWAGLEMTKLLKQLREELKLEYKIIGVGGVVKPEDYLQYRTAGADIVMSATGAMWNPYLAQEIKKQIATNK